MAFDVEKELKIVWIAGIIVLLFYGLWLFIHYESYYAILGVRDHWAPGTGRIVGGIFIAWAIIAIRLLKKLDNWEKLEEWMLFTVITETLILIAEIITIVLYYKIPHFGSILVIIITIFFILTGIHIIMQKRK